MTWLYLFSPVLLIVVGYLLFDRKRLMLFRQLNRIAHDPGKVIKIEMSVPRLAALTRSTISHTIDTGNAILFEYRTLVYMAIPLGEKQALVSKVADQSMIQKYRSSRVESRPQCREACQR